MLNAVVVMCEGTACIVGWINKDAFDLASKLLFDRFQRKEIVAEEEAVIEDVVVCDSVRRVVRLLRVLKQDARLQLRPVIIIP